jgi:hypothetical protein
METPVSPFLAPTLVRLRQTINLAWPSRLRTSDGWIGDAAHQARVSDHNPDPRGMVHAIDVTTGDATGLDPHVPTLLAWLLASPYVNYVIHNQRIWQAVDRFAPRHYVGDNPHTDHIHVSINYTNVAETGPAPWGGFAWDTNFGKGATGIDVRELQAYLNGHWAALVVDGVFGPVTDAAVRAFQTRAGIAVDGIVGPITRNALRVMNDVT